MFPSTIHQSNELALECTFQPRGSTVWDVRCPAGLSKYAHLIMFMKFTSAWKITLELIECLAKQYPNGEERLRNPVRMD